MSDHPADRIIDLYHRNAPAWIRLRGLGLVERDWLDHFLATMPEGGRKVLDLGCGSGRPIGDYLIGKGCRITGVDGAAALIGMARESFPDQRWIVADMRSLPALGQFDGVIAWHSFFHLRPEDQQAMFGSFARLCRPGAALIFTSGTEFGEAMGTFEGQPLYHGSLDRAEYRLLLESGGFDLIRHVENDQTCGGATVWLARKRVEGG